MWVAQNTLYLPKLEFKWFKNTIWHMISQLVILLVALRLEGLPLRIFKGDIGNPGRGLNIQYLYYMYVINYVDLPIVSGSFNGSADC